MKRPPYVNIFLFTRYLVIVRIAIRVVVDQYSPGSRRQVLAACNVFQPYWIVWWIPSNHRLRCAQMGCWIKIWRKLCSSLWLCYPHLGKGVLDNFLIIRYRDLCMVHMRDDCINGNIFSIDDKIWFVFTCLGCSCCDDISATHFGGWWSGTWA